MTAALRLRPLRLHDETEAVAGHEELAGDGFEFLLGGFTPGVDWAEFIARLERYRCGVDLPEGYVPATFLVAVVDGVIVGRTSVRHELNDHLAVFGGHIGYGVRPAWRRRGYATEILRQSLVVARAVGVDDVLITCDDANRGSASVIERCGGVLEDRIERPDGSGLLRRYWVRG